MGKNANLKTKKLALSNSPLFSPLFITMILSQVERSSGISEDTTNTPFPCSASRIKGGKAERPYRYYPREGGTGSRQGAGSPFFN